MIGLLAKGARAMLRWVQRMINDGGVSRRPDKQRPPVPRFTPRPLPPCSRQ
jgi:hypothetical protein